MTTINLTADTFAMEAVAELCGALADEGKDKPTQEDGGVNGDVPFTKGYFVANLRVADEGTKEKKVLCIGRASRHQRLSLGHGRFAKQKVAMVGKLMTSEGIEAIDCARRGHIACLHQDRREKGDKRIESPGDGKERQPMARHRQNKAIGNVGDRGWGRGGRWLSRSRGLR